MNARNDGWWSRYTAYLSTPQWSAKREAALERDHYLCQACRRREATQVHHTTYKHVGNEPLFELVSLCEVCHDEITAMDRKRRGQGLVPFSAEATEPPRVEGDPGGPSAFDDSDELGFERMRKPVDGSGDLSWVDSIGEVLG